MSGCGWQSLYRFLSQLLPKMASSRPGLPILAPPLLSEVPPRLPWKQCHCWSDRIQIVPGVGGWSIPPLLSPSDDPDYDTTSNHNCIQRRKSKILTISSVPRELSPTRSLKGLGRNRVQTTCNASSAYHVQHVVLRATWYERTVQLLSLTELNSQLF